MAENSVKKQKGKGSETAKSPDGQAAKYPQLLLDNQLCFPLYVCAREIVNLYTPYLKEIDLTYTQYVTMMVMWEEKSVRTRHLQERLFLDSGTLTPVIKKLVEKGLVTKERSKDDARDRIVTLTDEGEALADKAAKIPEQVGMCLRPTEDIPAMYDGLRAFMEQFGQRRSKDRTGK
ncbi:MAG: MarR family transcriptional regulator [Eubacterium sp.]|nr:MarR family transcriptional regulator [Eubacterium sp.]